MPRRQCRESVLQHRVGSGPPQPRRRPIGLEYARNEFDCVLDRFDETVIHQSILPAPRHPSGVDHDASRHSPAFQKCKNGLIPERRRTDCRKEMPQPTLSLFLLILLALQARFSVVSESPLVSIDCFVETHLHENDSSSDSQIQSSRCDENAATRTRSVRERL